MNRFIFDSLCNFFNKGDAFCIMLVLQKEKPSFYDYIGMGLTKYKQFYNFIQKIKISYPFLEIYTPYKYKCILFDKTINSLDFVKNIYLSEPVVQKELNERYMKEAKLFGYPSRLIEIEKKNSIRTLKPINITWYYITYVLTDMGKRVGDIYTFYCSEKDLNIKNIKEKKEIYKKVLNNYKKYNILLCIEKKTFNRIII